MSLDLGELVGYLVTDSTRWDKGIDDALRSVDQFGDRAAARARAAGDQTGDAFGDGLVPQAEAAGEEAGEAAGEGLKAKGAIAATAAGAAFGMVFAEALDVDAGIDKMAAQLGAAPREAARLGAISSKVFAGAYGEDIGQVNDALVGVIKNVKGARRVADDELAGITGSVLDLVAAFDQDLAMTTAAVGQMLRTGLAKDATEALDIITVGLQGPANKADDLMETFNEYGTQFRKLGLDGQDAVLLMSQAMRNGARDSDIAADALKEFSLRSVGELTKTMQTADGPVASLTDLGEAFRAAGYDALDSDPKLRALAGTLQQDIAGGGEKARDGLQVLLEGLRDTDDPLERSRLAVALFGTQAEDMGDALYAMDLDTPKRKLKDFEGAASRMGDTLADNTSTKLTTFKRKLQTEFVDYFVNDVIPVIEDDVLPAVERFADWFEQDGGPALKDFAEDIEPAVEAVKDLAGFLADLPDEAQLAGVIALLGGLGALKVRGGNLGGGGGLLGSLGSAAGLAKPVPVFVTNPGGLPGPDGPGGKPGIGSTLKGGALAFVRGLGLPAIAGVGTDVTRRVLSSGMGDETASQIQTAATTGGGGGFGSPFTSDYFAESGKGADKTADKFDRLTAKAKGFKDVLDLVGKAKVDPHISLPRLPRTQRELQRFLELEIEAGRPITPYVALTGYERVMSQIETMTAAIHAVPTAGLDNGVPFVSGGAPSPRGGVTNVFTGDMRPYDSREFYRDVQRKSQQRGHGGHR